MFQPSCETFIGNKHEKAEGARGYAQKNAVHTLVQRGAGARSFHVDGMKASDLLPIIKANVALGTAVMTDEAGRYAHLSKLFASHGFTRHGKGEYVVGDVHTNTVEGFYSVFKRGMKSVYQHCRAKHLHRYVAELDSGTTTGCSSAWDDAAPTVSNLRGIVGKRHTSNLVAKRGDN